MDKNRIHWIDAPGGEIHGLVKGIKIFTLGRDMILRCNIADVRHAVVCSSMENANSEAERILAEQRATRGSKYHAVRTKVGDLNFDSKGEAGRWGELKIQDAAGEIENLRRQVSFPIIVNAIRIATYRADFVYRRAGVLVVEDFKGVWTPKFVLIKKLMLAVNGIDIFVSGNKTPGKHRRRQRAGFRLSRFRKYRRAS